MKKHYFVIVILIFFSTNNIFGQKDSANVRLLPRPPIFGIPAKTLPKGKFIYRSYFTYTNYTQKQDINNQIADLPSDLNFMAYSYTPKLRYGINNKLTFIANFPLYYKTMYGNSLDKKGIGLGDVVIAGLYKFFSNKPQHFLISGLLFTKYPTGKSFNLQAEELPLGSGSFDGGLAFMPEKEFGKLDMRFAAFYIFRSKNGQNIDLGDIQSYSLSMAYNFSRKIIAETTILYKAGYNSKMNGIIISGSNTYLSQVITGIQYRLAQTLLLQIAIPITITAKIPFKSKYDIWCGFYYLL